MVGLKRTLPYMLLLNVCGMFYILVKIIVHHIHRVSVTNNIIAIEGTYYVLSVYILISTKVWLRILK